MTGFLTSSSGLVLVAVGVYGLVGLGVAVALLRRGRPPGAAVGALVVWPLLLSALGTAPVSRSERGPTARGIHEAFVRLEEVLADPAAAEVPWEADLVGLREALERADARVGLVDRLLDTEVASLDGEVRRSQDALREARDRAVGEIEAVLAGVAQLRLQVGMVALAGDAVAVGDRLRELRDRVRALEEVSTLGDRRARA